MRIPSRTLRVLTLPLVLAALLVGAVPGRVLADCTSLSPWPSFSRSASSAQRIIVGTVTWTPGGAVNIRFTLRVDEVLRGKAPSTIDFNAFRSGAPQPVCPEDSSLVVRHVGDRLAFAYGAHLPGVDRPITAVAFVAPSEPDRFLMPEMEQLTVAQVRAIAALPPADAISPASVPGPTAVLVGGPLALVAALAFVRRQRLVVRR